MPLIRCFTQGMSRETGASLVQVTAPERLGERSGNGPNLARAAVIPGVILFVAGLLLSFAVPFRETIIARATSAAEPAVPPPPLAAR